SEDDVVAALRAGADGYLLKDMAPLEMLESLRDASRGRVVLSERLTDLIAHALRQEASPANSDSADLTAREEEILGLIAAGRSNKLIARELAIAEGTVKVHVKRILKKLRLHSRVEAAVWAVKHGYRR
ncbi:MAG: LuxR C-terminal-related transcriptional regulator, partial [Candidatus Competibacteraceae bacterium]|nr:LuxR C-terminal-related transcriptional regulator [Candidatus Competibacteraceae bacterium]